MPAYSPLRDLLSAGILRGSASAPQLLYIYTLQVISSLCEDFTYDVLAILRLLSLALGMPQPTCSEYLDVSEVPYL